MPCWRLRVRVPFAAPQGVPVGAGQHWGHLPDHAGVVQWKNTSLVRKRSRVRFPPSAPSTVGKDRHTCGGSSTEEHQVPSLKVVGSTPIHRSIPGPKGRRLPDFGSLTLPPITCSGALSGCGAVWLAHQAGGLGAAGSNPAIPTKPVLDNVGTACTQRRG